MSASEPGLTPPRMVHEDLIDSANRDARRGKVVRGVMLGAALLYVGILLLAPLTGIVWKAFEGGIGKFLDTFSHPDVTHALYLTAVITVITVLVTGFFGVLVALVLARDDFPGKRLVSGFVNLPLAVSPVIVGLMAFLLFGRGGWFEPFFTAQGIQILFAVPAMVLVTIFISIPFTIREVAPVLEELGMEEEQAAWTLGASRISTFFRITLPNIKWGLLYGVALSTARALGEIGAVLLVSGIIKGKTETATIFILTAFEERQDAQGYAVALILAGVSILLLIGIEIFKRRRFKEAEEAA